MEKEGERRMGRRGESFRRVTWRASVVVDGRIYEPHVRVSYMVRISERHGSHGSGNSTSVVVGSKVVSYPSFVHNPINCCFPALAQGTRAPMLYPLVAASAIWFRDRCCTYPDPATL